MAIVIIAMVFFSSKLFFKKTSNYNRLASVFILLLSVILAVFTFFEGSISLKVKEATLIEAVDIIEEKERFIMEVVPKEIFDVYGQDYCTENHNGYISYENNLTQTEIEEKLKEYLNDSTQINEIGKIRYIVDDYYLYRNEIYLGLPELRPASIIIFSDDIVITIIIENLTFKEADLLKIANSLDADKQITELIEYAKKL